MGRDSIRWLNAVAYRASRANPDLARALAGPPMRRALALAVLLGPACAAAQDVSVATFNCEFLVRSRVHVKFGLPLRIADAAAADRAAWAQPGFRDARFAEAAAAVAGVLAQTGADVLALTEVGDDADVAELQRALAARGAPYPHRFVGTTADFTTGQHVAVLSRLPLSRGQRRLAGRELYVAEPDDPETEEETGLSKALRVTVDARGRALVLYLAHLVAERGGPEADAQRLAQAAVLRRHLLPALMADSLVVVAGDLNDGRGEPPLRRLQGLDDLFPDLLQTGHARYFAADRLGERWTYEYEGVREQIDHVLVSFPVREACRTQRGVEARTLDHGDPLASDHRALVVTFHFRE
jgi:endonuclease/exonuclease/phosphatase (EEP) superfamily protein YafD